MGPVGVVEGHPVADDALRLEPVGQLFEVNGFLLQRSPQPFDEDVVHAATAPVHRDAHTGFGQCRDPATSGELRALIRVHDLGRAEAGDGLLQGLEAEARMHRVR